MNEVIRIVEDPALWNDPKQAQEIGKERKLLEGVVLTLEQIDSDLASAGELFEMAREENDDDTLEAVFADVNKVEKQVAGLEFRRMFANPMDPNPCFLEIQSGAG
ncbi:MAG: PCRF domain-containing protein, partial [Gallionellaceae bacterium]|nr:PCRF domain-containing protein [Gallionellaceae bacterium]